MLFRTPPRVSYSLCSLTPRSSHASLRGMAVVATTRKPKAEGSIASVFTTLSGGADTVLPPRFSDLKKEIWRDNLVESWHEVLNHLDEAVEEVATKGATVRACLTRCISILPIFACFRSFQELRFQRSRKAFLLSKLQQSRKRVLL